MLRRGYDHPKVTPKTPTPLGKNGAKTAPFPVSRGMGRPGGKSPKIAGDLPRAERETTLAFNDAETKAEVTTCRHDWMRQLERYGAVPETIQVFEHGDGEHRWYIVPKSWITKPYPKKLVPKAYYKMVHAKVEGLCQGRVEGRALCNTTLLLTAMLPTENEYPSTGS